MTTAERYQKYIEEHCKNCKHRNENLCEIRISVLNDVVTTKCCEYERDKSERNNSIKQHK